MRKVLIANRGEIAVRVIRACRETGISTVAVYSEADRVSMAVCMADEAAAIGPSPASQSYLRFDRILEAALRHKVDAIHPGYGFLSENAEFAEACEEAGLVFIGPTAAAIRTMGSKMRARTLAVESGVPVLPGSGAAIGDLVNARKSAEQIGYPVLIKASAGGGGKGMRRADSPGELESSIRDASSEAERSFGDGSVYLEKLLNRPRHIEIQVLGDRYGHMIQLGERECSIQRRHQKVIEESPSPLVDRFPGLRDRMGEAALRVALGGGYSNAGTVEFLVDQSGDFYFLEMNTRLQVEHPVTELVTALDLVHWQLRIAAGEPLTISQSDVRSRGSAVECRLYAEDPEQDFFPSPGTITRLRAPAGPGIRFDSGVYEGWTVPIDYDPLLAKLCVWGETRAAALSRMRRAIGECLISGIATNLSFFRQILADPAFVAGDLHTGFVAEWMARRALSGACTECELVAAVAAVALSARRTPKSRQTAQPTSRWLTEGRDSLLR